VTGSLAGRLENGNKSQSSPQPALTPLLRGVFATLLAIVGVELFNYLLFPIPNPAPIYMTAIVFAAFTGGLRVGLFSALLALLYVAYASPVRPDSSITRAMMRCASPCCR
jgi:hypothetical protein